MDKDNSISITLAYPLTLGSGEVLKTLTIRRAKAKDLRRLSGKSEAEQSLSLLSALTGLVPEDIDELDIADFQAAAKAVEQMVGGK